MREDVIIFPTPEEVAAYEALDPEERTYHAEPLPKIAVPLDIEDLELISAALKARGVLGVMTTIDAHWVALKVATDLVAGQPVAEEGV